MLAPSRWLALPTGPGARRGPRPRALPARGGGDGRSCRRPDPAVVWA